MSDDNAIRGTPDPLMILFALVVLAMGEDTRRANARESQYSAVPVTPCVTPPTPTERSR